MRKESAQVRDVIATTVQCFAFDWQRTRGDWRFTPLIVDDAISRLKPLPSDVRLAIVHIECAISNALDRFKEVRAAG